MTTKVNGTPGEEVKKPDGEGAPADEKKEPTVGEIVDDKKSSEKKETQPETVGLDKFLELKKENKELKKAIKDIEKKIEEGADSEDVSDDIKSLGEEFEVDPKFLGKLTKILSNQIEAKADARVSDRLKPLEEKDKEEKIDKTFRTHFGAALEKFPPELQKIVKSDVIKTLSLDPRNKDKTFTQLIEETYGHVVPGKRTIEKTTPGGGKEPDPIDYDKARRDPKYFSEIMADPDRKKKYNEGIEYRIGL